jgi:hypothetical protein
MFQTAIFRLTSARPEEGVELAFHYMGKKNRAAEITFMKND